MTLIKVGGAVKRFNYDDVEVLLQRIVDGDLTINLYFKRQNRAISIGDVRGLKPACLMSDDELGAAKAEYQKFNEWKSELQSEKSDWFILHLDTLMEAVNGGQKLGKFKFNAIEKETKLNRSIKIKTKFDGVMPEGVYFCTQAPKLTYDDLWVDEDELKASLQGEIIKTEVANTMQSDQPKPQTIQAKGELAAKINQAIIEFGNSEYYLKHREGTQKQLILDWLKQQGFNGRQQDVIKTLISEHYNIKSK